MGYGLQFFSQQSAVRFLSLRWDLGASVNYWQFAFKHSQQITDMDHNQTWVLTFELPCIPAQLYLQGINQMMSQPFIFYFGKMKTGVSLCVSQENSARISGGWHPIWPRLCSLPRSLPAVARWCCLEAWSLTRKVTWSGQGSAGRAGGRGGSHYPSVHSGSLYSGDRDEYFA